MASSPVDVIKTRYMNAPAGKYTGAVECAMRLASQEGMGAFYKGLVRSINRTYYNFQFSHSARFFNFGFHNFFPVLDLYPHLLA